MPDVRDTLRVFAGSRPSLRDLLASRTGTFDRAHCILPSDVTAGEPLTATVQAWDDERGTDADVYYCHVAQGPGPRVTRAGERGGPAWAEPLWVGEG